MIVIDGVFLLVALVWGKFVDWVFQHQWQGYWKSKFGEDRGKALIALVTHCLAYSIITSLPLLFMFNLSLKQFVWFWDIIFFSHLIIDNRYPVKLIMRLKGVSWESINNEYETGWLQLGIDQKLHDVFMVVAAAFVGRLP